MTKLLFPIKYKHLVGIEKNNYKTINKMRNINIKSGLIGYRVAHLNVKRVV